MSRGQSVEPWPLGVHRFVERLRGNPPPSPSEIVSDLEALTRQRAVLTRGWRALHVVGLVALPLFLAGYTLFSVAYVLAVHGRITPDVNVVAVCLWNLQHENDSNFSIPRQELDDIEVTLASHFRQVIADPRLATQEYLFLGLRSREQIDRALRRKLTEEDSRRASENSGVRSIVYFFGSSEGMPLKTRSGLEIDFISDLVAAQVIVALVALVAALACRGGLIRLIGLDIVTSDGCPVSRLRMAGRTALAWAPLIAVAWVPAAELWYGVTVEEVTHWFPDSTFWWMTAPMAMGLLVQFAGAVVAIVLPQRGIQDRLAGTWVVPR